MPAPSDGDAARADLRELLGHLETLRGTDLTRLQQARLDLAFVAAQALAVRLGAPERPAPAPPHIPTADGSRPPRVLVVDDNSINLHVALSMLRVLGVEGETATTGAEALDRVAAFPFDLVLLDVMLPDVDGIDVTREIRARFGDRLTVVGVTGMPGLADVAREAGMDAVYAKPLRVEQVAEALERCVAG